MSGDPQSADRAMSTIQRVLDGLTARGKHETAFEIARAQFAASVRASWPANLSGVAQAIDRAIAEAGEKLTDEEREELRQAADILRNVKHD